jgi:hypothetical protein
MDGFLQPFGHVFVAWLVIAEPVLGFVLYRKLKRRLAIDPRARQRLYVQTILWEWARVLVVAGLLWLTPGPLAALGLRLPTGDGRWMALAVRGGG